MFRSLAVALIVSTPISAIPLATQVNSASVVNNTAFGAQTNTVTVNDNGSKGSQVNLANVELNVASSNQLNAISNQGNVAAGDQLSASVINKNQNGVAVTASKAPGVSGAAGDQGAVSGKTTGQVIASTQNTQGTGSDTPLTQSSNVVSNNGRVTGQSLMNANIEQKQVGKDDSSANVRTAVVSGNQANVQQNNAVVQQVYSNGTVVGVLQNVNITDLSTNNITNVTYYNHTTNQYSVNHITEQRILNEYKNIVYQQAAAESGPAGTVKVGARGCRRKVDVSNISSVLQRLKDAIYDAKYLIDALFN